jgi:thiamine-monophosphate kinase
VNVGELGEAGLIEVIREEIARVQPEDAAIAVGIGDDAAVWRVGTSLAVATVDTLTQGVHFEFADTSWEQLGWKALAVNLSDVAAMGAAPRYALVALALPIDVKVERVRLLYQGLLDAAEMFHVSVVGGNVSRAAVVSITVTLFGEADGEAVMRRDAARPGDAIAVTGQPGSAAAGLATLTEDGLPRDASGDHLREAFLRPYPRVREGQMLLKSGVRCAVDTSDGLAADLSNICRASGVGARLRLDGLPLDDYVMRTFGGERAIDLMLHGGEDYGLLFTGPPDVVAAVRDKLLCPVSIIGEITAAPEIIVDDGKGGQRELEPFGWDHFKTP